MLHRYDDKGYLLRAAKAALIKAFKTYGLQTAEFFVLAVHVFVLGPILLAVSLLRTGRPLKRYTYLFRRNVLASYFRARIDYRFGGFHSCARRMNNILAILEDQLPEQGQEHPFDQLGHRDRDVRQPKDELKNKEQGYGDVHAFPGVHAHAFADLSDEEMAELAPIVAVYANLALCYLKMGAVEGACQVVVRAHNKLGINALPTLLDLDHQASQIVLASLAACRILENGGSATVVVKESPRKWQPQDDSDDDSSGSRPKPAGQNLRKSSPIESNVIPFPSPFS